MPGVDYRNITDALAGSLERLHEKRSVVESAQKALNAAQSDYAIAQQAAVEVQAQLQQHLKDVLPEPNRRP